MKPSQIEDIFPLTPMQQGMLFHSLFAPGSGTYFEQNTWTISGALDAAVFERAWQALLERHMALRAAFLWEGVEEPLQVIHQVAPLELTQQDWRDMPATEQEQRLQAFLAVDLERGFHLDQAPLMRCALFRTEDREHVFVWSHHHLLLDGWSQAILLQEFFQLYQVFARGQAAYLPPAASYRDYIAWYQRQNRQAAEETWRKELSGFTNPTQLKFAFPQPQPDQAYASYKSLLSPDLSAALRALARRAGITLNTVLQGAWGALLARYSGDNDVLFGATVSGRPAELPGADGMVGLFINTLPVRVQIDPERPCLAWLQELQTRQAKLRQYETSSLVDIQAWSETPRDVPLFESLVVYQNYPVHGAQDFAGLQIRPRGAHARTNYPLTLVFTPSEVIGVQVAYELAQFDAATIERLVSHLQTLLGSIVRDPAQPVGRLELLTQVERQLFLETWNDTRAAFPEQACAHELFEEQVHRQPDAVALVYGAQQLTYRQLDQRANQLAHWLRERGVGPEVCVGVCLERSPEIVVALLGIWKAGGAYIPLDPHYPGERLAFMLADAGIHVLVTQDSLLDRLPGVAVDVCLVDRDAAQLAQYPTLPVDAAVRPENLAYVIYTSGSTGLPKGTLLEHRGWVNFITAFTRDLGADPQSVVLQFSSPSFDASLAEIGLALCSGGRLVVADRETLISLPELSALMHAQGVNTAIFPPALLELLDPNDLPLMRMIMSAGDACTPQVVRRWAGRTHLWNGYGPTETTIGASWERLTPDTARISIGRPATNVRLYVLDAQQNPVPVGVSGELYIGGKGVARGYLNREDLTAEKFLPDPFAASPEARFYRTGDRVRWLPDGSLEFLGRLDYQVKLRGLRLELGEIESVLAEHPGVLQAVALVREDQPGDHRLVAYLVACPEQVAPDPTSLRRFLEQRLPAYMIPAAFVFMEALPLSASGKVERRSLPAPTDASVEAIIPGLHGPVEQAIAELWEQVLGVGRVIPEDNFFELGGHSLMATRLVSLVRETFQVEVPIRDLFEAPTLAGFSLRVIAGMRQAGDGSAPPILPAPREAPLPLSFAQQRLWFLEQLSPGNLVYNLPLAVRLTGKLDFPALQAALNEIVRRHEALRTRFVEKDGQACQEIIPDLALAIPLLDLTDLPAGQRETQLEHILADEFQKPFDLSQGPLLRCCVYRLESDEHVALLVIHHIISDGWSLGVLFRELSALYATCAAGKPNGLPPLPVQYADYAAWQRAWLQGEALERQLDYWREQLSDLPPLLELPTDRPRQALQSSRGAVERFQIAPEITRALLELSHDENATLFMSLLAAFQVLLGRYSQQTDIPVGSVVANRSRVEIEGLIGFFVNTLVLRGDLRGEPTFREVLAKARETCLGAYTHQDLPFETLVEVLQPQRDLSHTPLFQVMFVLDPPLPGGTRLDNLEVTALEAHTGTAAFDLSLSLSSDGDGLQGSLEYNTDLWDAATIARMLGHYENLLEAVTRDPDGSIWRLPFLSKAEEAQLEAWNQTEAPAPQGCIHQMFSEQARSQPEALAILFGDRQLTYGELDRRSNQLARYLRTLGVGAESLVALCCERSIEMVVGILGTLKAGGAYLPLDPNYPAERLSFMLADSGAQILLTQATLADRLPDFTGKRVCLDRDWALIAEQPSDQPDEAARPDNLAYMIYTSGSTGKPKGTLLEHRGLCNLAAAQKAAFAVDASARVLQFSSLSFDASVWETFMALVNGAALVLAEADRLASPPALQRLLQEQRVTHATLPPSVLLVLPAEDLPDLRVLVAAGEACPEELVARWGRGRCFFNAYGPTETTVCATLYACAPEQSGPPPIGRPLPNFRVHVVDERLQPVPVGVPGELLIGGAGLARGYHNRPDMTAEKFIPDPFSKIPNARLYRSGDLARYRPDGNVEFLGRIDHQVKLRGFRIELGEIEANLLRHPGVRQAAVVVAGKPERLVAFLVPTEENSPETDELRAFLRASLPEYMLPNAYLSIEALPLSPSGKVDRRSLAGQVETSLEAQRTYQPPSTPVQACLAEIAAALLGVERVSVADSFFDLGGHSLLATQFVSRIRETLQVELPLRALFEYPRIVDLAEEIERLRAQGSQTSTDVIRPVVRAGRRMRRSDLDQPGGVTDQEITGKEA